MGHSRGSSNGLGSGVTGVLGQADGVPGLTQGDLVGWYCMALSLIRVLLAVYGAGHDTLFLLLGGDEKKEGGSS